MSSPRSLVMNTQIDIIEIENAGQLFSSLEDMAFGESGTDIVFRGHADAEWELDSTLNRHSGNSLRETRHYEIDSIITSFRHQLARLGDTRMEKMDFRQKMEFARHHGVPTPVIDFTTSPYIALWFALFDAFGRSEERAAIYAIDLMKFGSAYEQMKIAQGHSIDRKHLLHKQPIFDVFRWERVDFFKNGYPVDELKVMMQSSHWNTRMHSQNGILLYDSISMKNDGVRSFESILTESPFFPKITGTGAVRKIIFPKSRETLRVVFNRLNRMGINGARLFGGTEGAAIDARNPYAQIDAPLGVLPSIVTMELSKR